MGKGGSKIPPEELRELTEHTHFDEKELKRWYNGFIKDCPDGLLNKEQFTELYSSFYESGNAKKFAEHVFRTFDVNGDASIDFREFICSLSVTTRGTVEEKLEWAFNIYDIDGNGYISQSEMISIVKAVQKMAGAVDDCRLSKSNVLKIFSKMDKNKDGELSLEEFLCGAKEDETFVYMLQAYTPR
ncbi:neurocalcin homolog [Hydractinia symbiolongicarpus]|uniref:neurocalcin homolog n=1 Tax=Hydractinia symbiolongicarpus TaxID=13093 RepID=UPI00254C5834|nr:neurocalcin homolog [Hydractinia symbiolongicarpus]